MQQKNSLDMMTADRKIFHKLLIDLHRSVAAVTF